MRDGFSYFSTCYFSPSNLKYSLLHFKMLDFSHFTSPFFEVLVIFTVPKNITAKILQRRLKYMLQ
jgi:hypothetical protein